MGHKGYCFPLSPPHSHFLPDPCSSEGGHVAGAVALRTSLLNRKPFLQEKEDVEVGLLLGQGVTSRLVEGVQVATRAPCCPS